MPSTRLTRPRRPRTRSPTVTCSIGLEVPSAIAISVPAVKQPPHVLQPQTLGVPPPPQVYGAVQVPQLTVWPQLLVTVPQFLLRHAAVLSGVQHVPSNSTGADAGQVQTLFTHISPLVVEQVPQTSWLPQLSEMAPQFWGLGQVVSGVQPPPPVLVHVPATHVSPLAQQTAAAPVPHGG